MTPVERLVLVKCGINETNMITIYEKTYVKHMELVHTDTSKNTSQSTITKTSQLLARCVV